MSPRTRESAVLDWLLEEDQPAVRYFALTDLLDRPASDEQVKTAKSQIASKGWAMDILGKQKKEGNWESRKDLYGPKYTGSNWMMLILSDLGLNSSDPRIDRAARLFLHDWLRKDLKEGDAEICVVGNLARFLTRFGYSDEPRVKYIFNWIVEHQKEDGGWHCFESETGTLDCWEGLAAYAALPREAWTRSMKRSVERGAEFYLDRRLTEEGQRYVPWFRLHYPNHYYYDFLVGLDVLTALGYGGDKRLEPALALLKSKRNARGQWKIEAAHPDIGRGANYSQRKKPTPFQLEEVGKPSKWVTLKATRILKRVDES